MAVLACRRGRPAGVVVAAVDVIHQRFLCQSCTTDGWNNGPAHYAADARAGASRCLVLRPEPSAHFRRLAGLQLPRVLLYRCASVAALSSGSANEQLLLSGDCLRTPQLLGKVTRWGSDRVQCSATSPSVAVTVLALSRAMYFSLRLRSFVPEDFSWSQPPSWRLANVPRVQPRVLSGYWLFTGCARRCAAISWRAARLDSPPSPLHTFVAQVRGHVPFRAGH